MTEKYDIAVVGSGPGGYVAAIRAAQLGKKTAVVEMADLGGVCLNWGCIPTKAMLKSAQVYHYATSAQSYGIDLEGTPVANAEKIVARSRAVAETMSKGVAFLLKKNNVDVLHGRGELAGKGRLKITSEQGESLIEAEHIILATGARPRQMPFMPVDGRRIISSREALTLTELPQSMIVCGSGAIGSEFAYLYASLGVKVTVVEYLPNLMPLEDEEVSAAMERAFRKMRITVMTSTAVKSVTVSEEGCTVEVEGKKGAQTLSADVVLSAVGIKTNTENIGLETVGIQTVKDKIPVDEFLQDVGRRHICDRRFGAVCGTGARSIGRGHLLRGKDLRAQSRTGGLLHYPLVRIHLARSGVGGSYAAAGRTGGIQKSK
ncbi:MAG: FAD-dependent oxidoreductase [Alistipes putredinis]|nr:MAG: FAD-dependent oxidoreductase [Alistipes putredinis]